MTATEPTPVGQHLAAAGAALRARADAAAAKPERTPLVEPAEVAEVRRAGRAELRAERWGATIPVRFRTARLADFDGSAHATLSAWAEAPDGRNLLLAGPVGTGKTHAAVAACYPPHCAGAMVRFAPVVELLDDLRPGGPEGAWHAYAEADLLVLDDLGTERATDWTGERLGALVNRRWLEARPTVVTTNLSPPDLEAAIGSRTYSRLVGEATTVRLAGADRRRAR